MAYADILPVKSFWCETLKSSGLKSFVLVGKLVSSKWFVLADSRIVYEKWKIFVPFIFCGLWSRAVNPRFLCNNERKGWNPE